ncbi:MAG: DNA alkylation repair protein [Rikenellaceae bacterium]|nr:DNA alkylation repair protein [Rikenellaceae bacterium]
MNDTARMVGLLRRLRTETNGAVVEAMEQRGVHYPLSYGVAAHTIKKIAGEYGTDHSLALLLFSQQVRELKLAALYIADPARLSAGIMEQWTHGMTPELADHAAAVLFCRVDHVTETALEWTGGDDRELQSMALLMLGRAATGPDSRTLPDSALETIGRRAVALVAKTPDDMRLSQAATFFLARLARRGEAQRDLARALAGTLEETPGAGPEHLRSEIGWQTEYL